MSFSAVPSLSIPQSKFSQAHFDELRAAVRGPVLRPSDPEFAERSTTFNGKLVCLSRALVSPLDAQDVSAIVRFCTKHGLSPSVKAGGYATAGWSVAGDVIIDLAMMRECEIEPPLPEPEAEVQGGKDWTRLRDMPLPGSKGKARAGEITRHGGNVVGKVVVETLDREPTEQPAASSTVLSAPPVVGSKRRREDSPQASEDVLPKLKATQEKRNLLRSYDGASEAMASFLHGPPLEPEEGEEPRQPPANRRRIDSAEYLAFQPSQTDPVLKGAEKEQQKSGPAGKSGSGTEEGAVAQSAVDSEPAPASSSLRSFSQNSTAETSALSSNVAPSSVETGDPFGYMSSDGPSASHPRAHNSANPFALSLSTWAPGAMRGLPGLGMSMGSWTPPPSASMGAQGVWSAGVGPSMLSRPLASLGSLSGSPFPPMPGFPPSMGSLARPFGNLGPQMAPAQPVHKHAYITLGAGMRQKEVDIYTAEHPLEGFSSVSGQREDGVVPYHMPSSAHPTGSSILLLAGFGFISRMHGLSIDNLVEMEMVLADGRIVIVNEEDEPELWWAVRGAGPALGIATRYKVRAFPVPVVFAGNLVYRFHRATAPSLIKHFRDCIKGAPRELYANVLLTAGPADKDSLVVIQMCYIGPKEKGIEYLNAISSWEGERCLLNEVNEKSYINQQDSVAQILRGKAGRQWFIRSALIHSLPDEVINKTVLQFANTPIGCTWLFELAGGAIADFEDTCLPKEQREATWTVAALHQWEMGIDDPRCITSAEEWIDRVIGTVALGGPYPSFLARHEPPSRAMASFGKNWARLAELKQKYDPQCLFKNNFWPIDKHGDPIQPLTNEPPSP